MKYPSNIALVDCNNFYVSCERLFRPDLLNRPVAVLSNNDGCIVSRSQEVKDLGIKMAVPVHQVRQLVRQHDIQLFSSNYPLYADLSARIMHSLTAFSPSVDVYSIDEAFIDLERHNVNATDLGLEIKNSLARWVGIPVGVGIGPTKTLAKLANYAAKKWPSSGGVVDINEPIRRQKIMQITPVGEVWGVGRRLNEKLNTLGIETVWDLQSQPINSIKKHFNITLAQTVQELQGTPVMSFNEEQKPKQQIICSRSFKDKVTDRQELEQVLSIFCLKAAEKLRAQKGVALQVSVFIRTSPFDKKPFYSEKATYKLKSGTQDSRDLIKIAKKLLAGIFLPGYQYQKAGVTLGDIQLAQSSVIHQQDIFNSQSTGNEKSVTLMKTMDAINSRFNNSLRFAAAGNKSLQQSVPINRSSLYTTNWKEIARVK
ncbi:Y-family DNA polymerase [Cycloclasticus sp.]|uniref:Y-family DNA polymerase n=1 Tax=Cycloclasticus sp. TaxID=2024830 RepID=UPI000C0EF168|nr:Y-family DNA polymerase [Cycloclasticus sp.]PHR49440.1 MAG: DNA polymerase V subunit UmuC [Cycloclasticus sp.]